MDKEKLKEMDNIELNNLLREKGLNPCVNTDEDREVAISILSQVK